MRLIRTLAVLGVVTLIYGFGVAAITGPTLASLQAARGREAGAQTLADAAGSARNTTPDTADLVLLVQAEAVRAGLLVEKVQKMPSDLPVDLIDVELSGAPQAVLRWAAAMEQRQPAVRFASWRIEVGEQRGGGARLRALAATMRPRP